MNSRQRREINVVAVLPDGEDPDTFAKKLGQEKLLTWLDENSQDFIRFKIDLLDEEAKGDPVKRTELVRSVVKSIAEVPDELAKPAATTQTPGGAVEE